MSIKSNAIPDVTKIWYKICLFTNDHCKCNLQMNCRVQYRQILVSPDQALVITIKKFIMMSNFHLSSARMSVVTNIVMITFHLIIRKEVKLRQYLSLIIGNMILTRWWGNFISTAENLRSSWTLPPRCVHFVQVIQYGFLMLFINGFYRFMPFLK